MKKTLVFFVFTCVMGLMFTSASAQEMSIPAWIKNNAGWWSNDQIPDSTFIDGIEFLIEKEIIVISDMPKTSSEKAESIPAWIKNNAGWWADDQIGDETFVNGLQYLIKVGIIVIESSETYFEKSDLRNLDRVPSNVKLFPTSKIITEGPFSEEITIYYMETIESGYGDSEFIQIWIEVHNKTDEILGFQLLKLSEAVVDEYDGTKVILIEALIKSDGEIRKVYLHVEEYENLRTVKYFEYKLDELFRQMINPIYFSQSQYGVIDVYQADFALKDKYEDQYKKIGFTNEVNKPLVIIPTFTASAYSPGSFYAFYAGNCDETCLTTPITNTIKDLGYTSSGNGLRILDLLGYDSISDRQLHLNPSILDEYDSVILLHNEYVSRTMFNAITSHDNVIFLYPNALYAQVNVDMANNLITLVRGHNYPENHIINGFDWKNENTHPYEYDTECENWEFYPTKGTPNGYMLNCYPENIIWKDELFLKTLKDLAS